MNISAGFPSSEVSCWLKLVNPFYYYYYYYDDDDDYYYYDYDYDYL